LIGNKASAARDARQEGNRKTQKGILATVFAAFAEKGYQGVTLSGLMMLFPKATASESPGWIFNVATTILGEDAFLAAVSLFTVHYFDGHFRPDRLPRNTGSVG